MYKQKAMVVRYSTKLNVDTMKRWTGSKTFQVVVLAFQQHLFKVQCIRSKQK